ncbi:MAG: SgcJ/EcaC family oxidoreductase [Pseudomonadales bacterium]|jgi:limonene-1,2-epoxide hydrolase|nr:SgcJ/EcaC family oxidoreductase [Pseudomonadales bacterium]
MADNAAVIREFMAAWSRLDAEELAGYFTDDGVYHNIPAQPVAGREAVQQFIAGFSATWTETVWDIRTLIAEGDVVVCERTDRTKTTQGDVDLPCVGVFEMRDGRIAVWRDYFDLSTYMNAMTG